EVTPTELGTFLAHPDPSLGPVQYGFWITTLLRDVHLFVTEDLVVDDRAHRPLCARETASGLVRPLHRRASAFALLHREIVAHADLVAVLHHRSPGQREQQAERELESASVVLQHRGEPAADTAIVELHRLVRRELLEHSRALLG